MTELSADQPPVNKNNTVDDTHTVTCTPNIPKSQSLISVVSDDNKENLDTDAQTASTEAALCELNAAASDAKSSPQETIPSSEENSQNISENSQLIPSEIAPNVSTEASVESSQSIKDNASFSTESSSMEVDPSNVEISTEPVKETSTKLVETKNTDLSNVEAERSSETETNPSIPVSSNVPTCDIPSTVESQSSSGEQPERNCLYSETSVNVEPDSVHPEVEMQTELISQEVDHVENETFIVSHPEPGEVTETSEGANLIHVPVTFSQSTAPTVLKPTRIVEQEQALAASPRPRAVKTVAIPQPHFIGPGTVIINDDNVISIPEDNKSNVISIPEDFNSKEDLTSLVNDGTIHMSGLKVEEGARIQVSQGYHLNIPTHLTLSSGNTVLINQNSIQNNILAAAMAGNNISTDSHQMRIHSSEHRMAGSGVKVEPLGMLKAPSTDMLLKTAKEVLQLEDEPTHEYRRVFHTTGGMVEGVTVDEAGNILSTTTDQGHQLAISDEVGGMEVSDENGTYIIESVNGGDLYEDPNIMWIEETVEVEQESYDNLPNMVIILNPNGTVNEELMLANGMNMETIKAVTEAATGGLNLQTAIPASSAQTSINSLQHPIPKKLLTGVHPLMSSVAPRTVVESSLPDQNKSMETQRSVILDPKDDYLILDDHKDPMLTADGGGGFKVQQQQQYRLININGTQHLVTSSKPMPELRKIQSQNVLSNGPHLTPLGTLDLSLPKKEEGGPGPLDQFVNPSALVSHNTVLKVLDDSGEFIKFSEKPLQRVITNKVRRPRMRDENGNGSPYIHRKTTSLGALGQALHGIPRDSRENAVQICPICKFQATTKNPYRHLQDHLARMHFKDRIAAELPTKKPYKCPFESCDGKSYPDWQAVMRHYIGKKHGILDKYVKEELTHIRRENGGRIPGTVIRPGVELML